MLITNVAYEKLSTARYDIYRGVLDYEGEQLRKAFVTASERMIERGVHGRAAHEEDIARLAQAIREAAGSGFL